MSAALAARIRRALATAGVAATVSLATPHPAPAQSRFAADAFLDPVALELYTAAFDGWTALDESVVRYTARIDQRIAAAIRAPLRDRVLYHNETAVRAFWERDYDAVVQVLGSRSEYPGRSIAMREGDLDWLEDLPFDGPFEPGDDRLFLGMNDEAFSTDAEDNEFSLIHPLASGADTIYRFQSGDTMTLSFPDGRRLEAVQLDVLPREAAPQRISGILWIERETGALVRAAYRMSREFDAMRDVPDLQEEDEAGTFRFVPGLFKPWTFNLNVVSVDYLLWDFKAWLPRSMRIEGEARAGIIRFPVSMDMAYQVESVVLKDDVEVDEEGDPAVSGDEVAPGAVTTARDGMKEVHFATRAEAMAFVAALLSEDDRIPYELMDESEGPAADRESLLIVPEDRSLVAESPHLPPPVWGRRARVHRPRTAGGVHRRPRRPARPAGADGPLELELGLEWARPRPLQPGRRAGFGRAVRLGPWRSLRPRHVRVLRVCRPAPQGATRPGTLDRLASPDARCLPRTADDGSTGWASGIRELPRGPALRPRQR